MNNELYHYGVKGMKWGHKKARIYDESSGRQNRKARKKYEKLYKKNYVRAYNRTADYANKTLIPQINEEYTKKYGSDWFKNASEKERQKYYDDYQSRFDNIFSMTMEELIGKYPG